MSNQETGVQKKGWAESGWGGKRKQSTTGKDARTPTQTATHRERERAEQGKNRTAQNAKGGAIKNIREKGA